MKSALLRHLAVFDADDDCAKIEPISDRKNEHAVQSAFDALSNAPSPAAAALPKAFTPRTGAINPFIFEQIVESQPDPIPEPHAQVETDSNSVSYEDAFAEGRQEANAEWEARLADMEISHRDAMAAKTAEIDSLRAEMANLKSSARSALEIMVATQISDGFAALETEIAEAMAEVLRPMIEEHKQERIIKRFSARISEFLRHGGVNLSLTAPSELIDKIAVQTLVDGHFVDIHPNARNEAIARFDRTLLRAQFSGWVDEAADLMRSVA